MFKTYSSFDCNPTTNLPPLLFHFALFWLLSNSQWQTCATSICSTVSPLPSFLLPHTVQDTSPTGWVSWPVPAQCWGVRGALLSPCCVVLLNWVIDWFGGVLVSYVHATTLCIGGRTGPAGLAMAGPFSAEFETKVCVRLLCGLVPRLNYCSKIRQSMCVSVHA